MLTTLQPGSVSFENTLENLLEGCQIIGFDWRYLLVNNAAAIQGRRKKEELLGHTMIEMYPGIEKTTLFTTMKRCMEKRVSCRMENEFNFADGSSGWFELKMEPVPDGILILSENITKRKEIDKAKSEFVFVASHALRTPLGIAKWYLEAIMSEKEFPNLPPKISEYIGEIYKNNTRLLVLVRDLLSVSRIDQGKVKDNPKAINITELVKSVVQEMKRIAEKNTVELTLILRKQNIPLVFIDPLLVQEVLENLLSNAIKYNVPQGKIIFTLDQEETAIIFIVQDTGIGIATADKENLFTKFFRAENAVSTNTEGSGLGLYVVKSYVEKWGGSIVVESEIGKGTTFIVKLPLVTKKE